MLFVLTMKYMTTTIARWICFRLIRFTAGQLIWFSAHNFFLHIFFSLFYLKFVSKYIWHLIWRGSLAHAQCALWTYTHLSSYLFVFYISWFDTRTQHSLTLSYTLTFEWILFYPFKAMAQWSERDREKKRVVCSIVAQHKPLLLLPVYTCMCSHTSKWVNEWVYITLYTESTENLRLIVMLEHAAFSPKKVMNENCATTARRRGQKNTINPFKNEIVPPLPPPPTQPPPLPNSSSTFSPIYSVKHAHVDSSWCNIWIGLFRVV